jgi:Mn2+/Fe2+ NRAMP family transporter
VTRPPTRDDGDPPERRGRSATSSGRGDSGSAATDSDVEAARSTNRDPVELGLGSRLWRRVRRGRVFAYLAIAGPGVIAANAGNDAAGIATYSSAGSQFVYRTLFFMVLVTIALVLVQEMAVRLGTFTGKGLAALIREQFSLRLTGLALLCVLLANTGLVVSEFAGIGAAFELFGISRYLVVPLSALLIWALVLFGSYRYAERIFLVFSLAFLAYPIAAVLARPDWSAVGADLVFPHFLASSDFVLLGVALIGTTVSPYMQLYAAAGVVDCGAGPEDYPVARLDAISGAVFACIISVMIIIATGATIGGQGPLTSAAQAAQALEPVAGPGATLLFAFGLLGASALAGAVVPLSSSYAISEAVGVERSVSRSFRQAPLFLGLFTFQVFLGAAVALTPVNLIQLLIGTQVLQGVVAPIVLSYILILSNRRSVLGTAANGRAFRIAATVTVAAVAAMSLLLVGQTVLGLLGLA